MAAASLILLVSILGITEARAGTSCEVVVEHHGTQSLPAADFTDMNPGGKGISLAFKKLYDLLSNGKTASDAAGVGAGGSLPDTQRSRFVLFLKPNGRASSGSVSHGASDYNGLNALRARAIEFAKQNGCDPSSIKVKIDLVA